MRSRKSPWILLLLILSGALLGGMAGELVSRNAYFTWVGLGGPNGYRELFSYTFNPLVDTHFLKVGFDIALRINAGSLVGILLGIFTYTRL